MFTLFLFSIIVYLGQSYAWQDCKENLNPSKVIDAMGKNNPGLRILTAHRGAHAPGCPENSRCSIDAAVALGFETIELDVRADKHGGLWPSHDSRIGRCTDYKHLGRLFDIYKDDPFGPQNPAFEDMDAETLRNLHYRDSRGRVTGERLSPLFNLLAYIKIRHPGLVVLLDIKSASALDRSVHHVINLKMQHQVVVKFPTKYLRPGEVLEHLKGVKFIPICLASDMDAIATDKRNERLGNNARERVLNFYKEYINIEGFVGLEPPAQQFVASRYGIVPSGPFAFVDKFFGTLKSIGFGRYSPSPDSNDGFYTSQGHCCVQLSAYFDHSKIFGDQTADDRPNLLDVMKTSTFVASDKTYELMSFAKLLGFRRDVCSLVG